MGTRDKRSDAYIAKSPDFAKPILKHIREIVHAACPQCEETLKWNTPSFTYNGKLMVGMASLKGHCRLILWQGQHIPGVDSAAKIENVADLPSKNVLTGYIKQSMKLLDAGVKVMDRSASKKVTVRAPAYLMTALKKNTKGAEDLGRIQPERASGLRRMDHGREARGDAREAAGDRARVDRGRQAA